MKSKNNRNRHVAPTRDMTNTSMSHSVTPCRHLIRCQKCKKLKVIQCGANLGAANDVDLDTFRPVTRCEMIAFMHDRVVRFNSQTQADLYLPKLMRSKERWLQIPLTYQSQQFSALMPKRWLHSGFRRGVLQYQSCEVAGPLRVVTSAVYLADQRLEDPDAQGVLYSDARGHLFVGELLAQVVKQCPFFRDSLHIAPEDLKMPTEVFRWYAPNIDRTSASDDTCALANSTASHEGANENDFMPLPYRIDAIADILSTIAIREIKNLRRERRSILRSVTFLV